MNERITYYDDLVNDDFANVKRKSTVIDKNFKFIHKNIIWRFLAFIVYRIVMTPFAFVYLKLKFHYKIINKKVLKPFKKKGYFIYGNHTQIPGDAFIHNMVCFPKKAYVIVHPDNLALRGTKNYMQMVGAIPIPTNIDGMRKFMEAIEKRAVTANAVVIYPEAHIWPYYTKIRPFQSTSFKYPIKYKDASFCFVTTYQKRRISKKPKITIYVDGPFFPNCELPFKEQQEDLKNRIFKQMEERSSLSNYEYVKYVRRQEND